MGLRDLLEGLGRPKSAEALRERAKREFAKGNNAAGVAALLELGPDGNADDLFKIGECYETATGVMPNYVDATAWYERAAAKGHLRAAVKIGEFYLFGRQAHEEGEADDSSGRGANRFMPHGVSVPAEPVRALPWNQRAAETGSGEAQARLGYQYATGLGVDADHGLAERWFAAAAEQGIASGQLGLGMLYAGAYFGIRVIPRLFHGSKKLQTSRI